MKRFTKLFTLVFILLAWVNVTIAQNTECIGTLTEGTSTFNYKFETSGTDVIVTFEMETARTGLVAYAQTYNPNFAEVAMTNVGGQKFSKTFTDQALGANFKMACKFAWASGGILTTAQRTYVVGNTCVVGPPDTEIPTAFTAAKGTVGTGSVELLLNATDNSGVVVYQISYGSTPTVVNTSGISATQKSYVVANLTPGTDYTFSIIAKDAAGNIAANSPLTIMATTTSMAAAPTPTLDASKVISLFSNAYTNVPVSSWKTAWSAAGAMTDMQIAGDDTKKYEGVTFIGIETTGTMVDASTMNYFNVDILTDNITSLKIKLVDFGANGVYNGVGKVDDVESELTFTPGLTGWNSYHIPLTDFTKLTTKANIAQYIITAAPNGSSSFYLDNMYFSTETLSSVLPVSAENNIFSFSNPVSEKLTITAKSEISQIVVLNLIGQSVKTVIVNGELERSIDISSITAGNYLVTVKLRNGLVSTQKLVKL